MNAFTSKMLESVIGQLGLASAQLQGIDGETKRLLLGLMVRAVSSGNANAYLKVRLNYLAEMGDEFDVRRRAPSEPPRPARAPEPEVQVMDGGPKGEGARWRRRGP